MKKLLLVLALVFGVSTSAFGFATVVNAVKGGDEIVFNSNTQDVSVYLNGIQVGKYTGTEFRYKVGRDGKPKVFTFKKQGYKDVSITLTTTFDNMYWGNLLTGGTFGSSTDSWFTNNTQEYSPNQFFVQMDQS